MMQKIQANISGFSSRACTLYSALDTASGIVFVSTLKPLQPIRQADCLLVASDPQAERDVLFSADGLSDAIAAWQHLKSSVAKDGTPTRLHVGQQVQRANPQAAIEQDGWDAHGPRWRMNATVNNEQMAVLATCLIAVKHSAIATVLTTSQNANAAITRILSGQVYTL